MFKTNRDFLNAVIALDNAPAEVIAFAEAEIEKMNARNKKRASTPTAKQKDNDVLKETILSVLTETAMPAVQVASLAGTTTNKVASLCRQLAEAGKVVISEYKEKGKAKCNGYALPSSEVEG